jgi:hypothetical protein
VSSYRNSGRCCVTTVFGQHQDLGNHSVHRRAHNRRLLRHHFHRRHGRHANRQTQRPDNRSSHQPHRGRFDPRGPGSMARRHGLPGIGEAPRKPVHNRPIILLPGIVPLEPPETQHRFIRVFQRTPEDMAPDMLAPSLAAGVGAHFLRDGHRVIPRMCVPQSLSHLLQPANHGRIAFHHGHAGRTDHPGDARSFTGMTQQIGLFIGNQPAGLIDGDKLQFLGRSSRHGSVPPNG